MKIGGDKPLHFESQVDEETGVAIVEAKMVEDFTSLLTINVRLKTPRPVLTFLKLNLKIQ